MRSVLAVVETIDACEVIKELKQPRMVAIAIADTSDDKNSYRCSRRKKIVDATTRRMDSIANISLFRATNAVRVFVIITHMNNSI